MRVGDITQPVAPLALERGQATLPNLQITVSPIWFSRGDIQPRHKKSLARSLQNGRGLS